jgi:hypothetical protein
VVFSSSSVLELVQAPEQALARAPVLASLLDQWVACP